MYSQTRRNALIAVALMMAFMLACSAFGDETKKANELVAEGNTAIGEANTLSNDPDAKGEKAAETLSKAAEKFREAAKKFDEASKLKVKDKFKEYLSLKSQEFNKRAEGLEVVKKSLEAMSDNEDPQAMMTRAQEFRSQVEKLNKEATDLKTKADKIQSDNKDLIQ